MIPQYYKGCCLLFCLGSGDDRDNLELEQGLGDTLGQLEGRQVCRTRDKQHGTTMYVHLQEAHQVQQRSQGRV